MAYAALRSLAQILHQTLNRDYQYLILDEKQQIESLVEIITAIQKDFSSQKITQDEEREIRDSAYIVEDIIESRIIERFRTESAGNEDGSTEKKLVRFNVLEDWIVASSKSAGNKDGSMRKELVRFDGLQDWIVALSKSAPSRRSRLEIVGVGGVEKPITFQNIDGIRQLARTFRFKAWFLHSDVLLHDASPYKTRFLHSDVLHDDASPYSNAIWTLERLANHGTEIVIIDTSSMGTSATMEELRSFGFDTSLFVGVISDKDLRADEAQFEELGSSSPAPSLQPWATYNPEAVSSKMYISAMVMAGVDAADRCIAVGGDLLDLKAANAAGISSIIMANVVCQIIRGSIINQVGDFAAEYVLRSFTW